MNLLAGKIPFNFRFGDKQQSHAKAEDCKKLFSGAFLATVHANRQVGDEWAQLTNTLRNEGSLNSSRQDPFVESSLHSQMRPHLFDSTGRSLDLSLFPQSSTRGTQATTKGKKIKNYMRCTRNSKGDRVA